MTRNLKLPEWLSLQDCLQGEESPLKLAETTKIQQLAPVAQAFGQNVRRIDYEWGSAVRAEDVKAALDEAPARAGSIGFAFGNQWLKRSSHS